MKKRSIAGILAVLLLLAAGLTGCNGAGGVAQDVYDQLKEQYENLQEQFSQQQDPPTTSTVGANNEETIAELREEIEALKEQYVLEGDTTAETVQKIAAYYHDTHIYSATDLFVCSDMAAEVWNMLKAKGISAIMVVGSIDKAINDILASDHAWVLAEVSPGEYLAVETTNGTVKYHPDNPLYYRGWYYDSPQKIKDYQFLVREYNKAVAIHNDIVAYDTEVIQLHNASTNQAQADKYEAIHNKLSEIIQDMQDDLTAMISEIINMATILDI